MAQIIPFGAYQPDMADINAQYTQSIMNVKPQADGYGPWSAHVPFSGALPARCRGYFYGRNGDALMVFAGTETKLYQLNNTTLEWIDVSLGASTYAALSSDAQWQFAQFNNIVLATHKNVVLQKFDVTADSAFANLAGSPPQSAYISTINRFVVLSGLLSLPYRVHWSGLDAITTWTPGTGLCDFQDIPDGGAVRGVAGGEFGIIIQDTSLRRMVFSPGSDVIFQIDRIAKDTGGLAPYSIVNAGDHIFLLSPRGFIRVDGSGQIAPIGKERVDRTFLREYDSANLQLVIGASDPSSNQVIWVYKSMDGGQSGLFDRILTYDWVLDKWSPAQYTGEYIAALARPGLTLEALDAIAPGVLTITGAANNGAGLIRITVASTSSLATGNIRTITQVAGTTEANATWTITVIDATHFDLQGSTFTNAYASGGIVGGFLDQLSFSLDTVSASTLAQISMIDANHKLGFFDGDTIEATMETAEQTQHNRRVNINGLRPATDASGCYASLATRDRLPDTATYGDESIMDADGNCPVLEEGRYLRAKLRIPAASTWTYATGITPDVLPAGEF